MVFVSAIFASFTGIACFLLLIQIYFLLRLGLNRNFLSGIILSVAFIIFLVSNIIVADHSDLPGIFLQLLKAQLILMQVVLISSTAAVWLQLNNVRNVYYYSGLAWLGLIMISSLFFPLDLLFGNDKEMNMIIIGREGRFLIISPGLTVWRLIIDAAVLSYGVLMLVIILQNTKKAQIRDLVLYLLLPAILTGTAIYDQLIDLGYFQFFYLLPAGLFINYLIIVLFPLYQQVNEVFKRNKEYRLERKWRAFIEHANVIVVILNRMGNVEYINPFFLKISGYRESEVIGKDWFEFFIPPEQHYDVQSAFIEILEFNFHPHYRNPIVTKYQEIKIIDWYNVRLRDSDFQVIGSISIGIDITEENEQDESLRKRLHEAEELIDRLKQEGRLS